MSSLSTITITHTFAGDGGTDKVDPAKLDTVLGNISAQLNAVKLRLDMLTDSDNQLAAQIVRQRNLLGAPLLLVSVSAPEGTYWDIAYNGALTRVYPGNTSVYLKGTEGQQTLSAELLGPGLTLTGPTSLSVTANLLRVALYPGTLFLDIYYNSQRTRFYAPPGATFENGFEYVNGDLAGITGGQIDPDLFGSGYSFGSNSGGKVYIGNTEVADYTYRDIGSGTLQATYFTPWAEVKQHWVIAPLTSIFAPMACTLNGVIGSAGSLPSPVASRRFVLSVGTDNNGVPATNSAVINGATTTAGPTPGICTATHTEDVPSGYLTLDGSTTGTATIFVQLRINSIDGTEAFNVSSTSPIFHVGYGTDPFVPLFDPQIVDVAVFNGWMDDVAALQLLSPVP